MTDLADILRDIDIQEGDAVAYVTGPRDEHDYGRVLAVTADEVTIHWLGSETRHTHTAAQAAGWDVYTRLEDARAAFERADVSSMEALASGDPSGL